MDDQSKLKKKQTITAILVELEKILHNAINMEIEKALSPYEMILIAVKTLHEGSKKRQETEVATSKSPVPASLGKVLPFKRKE